ncbi:2,3-dihydroxybenzoate-AMP ligase [Kineosporia sp. NBRC 101677]|uniref:(2,3-dihydroxybenzoyl)adenylate synthase n=1 Tax=Kineosporia sp. NBRC 101677 TaxID=3032197 RepID=UPI0024A263A8|nr:AMP-binding protein [Kineosporia sp. NBRC 101677]GLY17124.1 2,3-dihydroxybenzoate-AMP ligase [Kineosporia sp. NBRC 101677]
MNRTGTDFLTIPQHYVKHWRPVTFSGSLRRWARLWSDTVAVVDPRQRLTYQELDENADRVAAGFARLGVGRGDRVVVQLPNQVEFLQVWFGLQRLGAVPVHAMPAHRRDEIVHLAATSGAAALVVGERQGRFDFRTMAVEVGAELGRRGLAVPEVVVVGEPGESGGTAFSELCRLAPAPSAAPVSAGLSHSTDARLLPVAEPDPDDPHGPAAGDLALLLISGGTTGRPKLIPRSHTDYDLNVRLGVRAAAMNSATVYLAVLPAGFNFTLACPGILGTLSVGGTVVLAPDPSPATAFDLIATEKVTHTALTPALVPHWLTEAETRREALATLQVVQVGGARLPDELARRAGPALGATIQQVYGMAEGLICYTALDDDPELVATTQGRPGCEDDELLIVRPGTTEPAESGELLVRGPYTLRSYYNAPAADSAFTSEGFYRTGDEVRRLPSGPVVVVGRVKDQINRAGEKYAAVEVEEHLLDLDGVKAAAIVGLPDPDWGEAAVAVLVHDGPAPTVRTLATHLRERGLAAYKAPQRVHSIDAMPLTPVGKVDKQALRARLAR